MTVLDSNPVLSEVCSFLRTELELGLFTPDTIWNLWNDYFFIKVISTIFSWKYVEHREMNSINTIPAIPSLVIVKEKEVRLRQWIYKQNLHSTTGDHKCKLGVEGKAWASETKTWVEIPSLLFIRVVNLSKLLGLSRLRLLDYTMGTVISTQRGCCED